MTKPTGFETSRPGRRWTGVFAVIVSLLALCVAAKGDGYDEQTRSLAGGVGGTKTISSVNLLLPISTCNTCGHVRQEIKATNGCYQW